MKDLLEMGIYATTALKCGRRRSWTSMATMGRCADLLDSELALFPNLCCMIALGNEAARMVDIISRRRHGRGLFQRRAIRKIRGGVYRLGPIAVCASFGISGDRFGRDVARQRLIGQDLRMALDRLYR